ncbi:c-type cytochrome [Vannielia litorea]|uniref:Cytochrome c n=1 Tax=Vannielia litorea TaxID=1217970 RepID=A0A1N6IFP7_9RHOB|nr:c-type cytochrome [Vannielia litorea]SIO30811.1 Cytochrome c [Vannielia litorea]
MNKLLPVAAAAAVVAGSLWYLLALGEDDTAYRAEPASGAAIVEVAVPAELSPKAAQGKRAFDATCAACHGENASGKMGSGPPLVHKIYEPSHHGDMAFVIAVQQGVRAHHWPFGDMPMQQGLTRADVLSIVAYVRELQRANGIE